MYSRIVLIITGLMAIVFYGHSQCISFGPNADDIDCQDSIGIINFGTASGGSGSFYYCLEEGYDITNPYYWTTTSGNWSSYGGGALGTSGTSPTKVYDVLIDEQISRQTLDGQCVVNFEIYHAPRVNHPTYSRGIVRFYVYNKSNSLIYSDVQTYITQTGLHISQSGILSGARRIRIEIVSGMLYNGNLIGNANYGHYFRYPKITFFDCATSSSRSVTQGDHTLKILQQDLSLSCQSNAQTVNVALNQNGSFQPNTLLADTSICLFDTTVLEASDVPTFVPTLNFDGSNDYVEINDVPPSLTASSYSFFAWIRSTASSSQMISGCNTHNGGNRALFYLNPSGQPTLYSAVSGHTTGTTAINDGIWHHVGYTYDYSSSTVTVYVDGQVYMSATSNLAIDNNDLLSIGQEWDGTSTSDHFNGQIGHISYWNAVLDTSDIALLIATSPTTSHPKWANLIANYNYEPTCNLAYLHDLKSGKHGVFYDGSTRFDGPTYSYDSQDTIPGYSLANSNLQKHWYIDGNYIGIYDSITYTRTDTLEHFFILDYINQGYSVYRDTVHVGYEGGFVELGSDVFLCAPDSVLLSTSSSFTSYSWSTGASSPSIYADSLGTYYLTVTDGSCAGSDSIHIEVEEVNLSLPSAFQVADTAACVNTEYTYETPSFVNSAVYDGVNDFSTIESLAAVLSNADFSISLWFRKTNGGNCFTASHTCNTTTNQSYINQCNYRQQLGIWPPDCFARNLLTIKNDSNDIEFRWYLDDYARWHFDYSDTSGSATTAGSPAISTYNTSWQHLAIAYSESNSSLQFFIDGHSFWQDSVDLNISAESQIRLAEVVDGTLAEITFWQSELDSATIVGLTESSPDTSTWSSQGLVAYYDFSEECSIGSILKDVSPNEHHGSHHDGASNARGNVFQPFTELPGYSNSNRYEHSWWSSTAGTFSQSDSISVQPEEDTEYHYTGTIGSMTVRDTFIINVLGINIDLGLDTTFCEEDGPLVKNLSTQPGYFLWDNNSTNASRSISSSGTYWAQATALNGCVDQDTFHVTVNPTPNLSISAPVGICPNTSDTLFATPGYLSYQWNGNQGTDSLIIGQAGTYTVQVVDSNGCSSMDSASVSAYPGTNVNLGPDTSLCENDGPLNLNAGVGGFFEWNTGSLSNYLVVSSSGVYSVVRTTQNGCTALDTVAVTIYDQPVVDLGPDLEVCADSSVVINAGSFSTYVWSDSSNQPYIEPYQSGSYWVQVTDSNGCVGSDDIQISFLPLPFLDLGPDTSYCEENGPYFLFGGNSGIFLWNDGSNSNQKAIASSGTYWLKKTSLNGCNVLDTVSIEVFQTPNPNLGDDLTICEDSSVVLSPGNFASYQWSTGESSSSIDVGSEGYYEVLVTDSNGCVGTDSTYVWVIEKPTVSLGNDTSLCFNQSAYFSPNVYGPVGSFYNYLWQNESVSPVYVYNAGQTENSTDVWVHVFDQHGCGNSDTILVSSQNCLGIEAKESSLKVSVFPNPFTSNITIRTPEVLKDVVIEIISAAGQVVFRDGVSTLSWSTIDLAHLASGSYILRVSSGANQNQFPILKI